jgi:Bacterial Ig-like domain (group 3)/FG-GAP-like repeat
MPSRSRSALVRRAACSVGLLVRRIAQPIARLEQRGRDYINATTPRRRLSRIAGVVLFACMSVGLMGPNSCYSCFQTVSDHTPDSNVAGSILAGLFVGLSKPQTSGSPQPRPRFTGTDGSQTGTASFLGNFTGIVQTPGNYFLMLSGADCSLYQFVGSSVLDGSFNILSYTPNYERMLHQLAALKTTADVYPHGCADDGTGISSRIGVALARKAGSSNAVVMGTAQSNGANNAVFILSSTADLKTVKFTPLAGLTAASALATADLNGDGNGDLVVVNDYNAASAYISVALGNGDGTFQNPVNYPTAGNMSVAATIADVNGDGKLDIVAVSDDQHISVLLGNGNGTFQSAVSFAAPALPGYSSSASTPILGLIAADVNGDGKKDLICSNGLVLLGSGTGTFNAVSTPAFPYTTANPGGFGPGFAAGDINNDGKTDLVLDTGTSISIWLGKGDGTFTSGSSYASFNNSGDVSLTDLDGDGNLDIYTGLAEGGIYTGDDSLNASAYALMGNGDGTFVGAPTIPIGAYGGNNLGDVNGDGVPDLITNGTGQFNTPGAVFTVQLGNGKGAFTKASTISAPASFVLDAGNTLTTGGVVATTYAVADINGDGKADLVFIESNLADTYTPGTNFFRYNGGPVLFTALSNGDGTFQTPVAHAFPQIAPANEFDVTASVSSLQIADFNKDGHNDLILSFNDEAEGNTVPINYSQGFIVLLGNGDGTFKATPIVTATYSSTVAPNPNFLPVVFNTADLNADTKPDLLVVNSQYIFGVGPLIQMQTYIGNGDGTFKTPVTLTTAANEYGIPVLADFNKDGKLDLAFLGETSASQAELVVALGKGDGTFATPAISNLSGGDAIRSSGLAGADFDGDGKIDLALFDANDFSGIFYGKGDGTFTSVPATGYVVPKDLINVAVGGPAIAIDLNKDAKPDILAGATVLLNLYGSAPVVTTSTTTALTASASTITVGSSITFTATVTPGGTGTPTGTVTFYDGTTVLGTGAVSASGVATYTTTGLTTGAQSFTAVYPGDTNFSASTSPGVSVTVTAAAAPDFSISLGATTSTVTHGNPATTTVSVTPSGGFTAATSVACTGAPANSSCSASPSPISPVGLNPASTTVTLQTSVTSASLATRAGRTSLAALPLGLLTATLLLFARKRRPAILVVVFVTAGLLAANGCGHNAPASPATVTTAPGTYTLTITGTSGAASHSAAWTVIVQ